MNRMKHAFFVSAIIAAAALPALAQRGGPPASPHDLTGTRIGGKLVTIYYGRPYHQGSPVRGDAQNLGRLGALGQGLAAGRE